MKHQYDWSKLDAGWRSYMSPAGLILEAPAGMVALVPSFEKGPVRPHEDAGWNAFQNAVISQLAKCRVGDNTPLFEAMDKMAEEAGAEDVPQYLCQACGKHGLHLCEKFYPEPAPADIEATLESIHQSFKLDSAGTVEFEPQSFEGMMNAVRHGYPPGLVCKRLFGETPAQLLGRIRTTAPAPVDNTPLFEAMDAMAEPAPSPEQAPPVIVRNDAIDGWLVGRSTPDLTVAPFQPWRRGPLAAWSLVNISNHDGRLTVVMKRGRGELVIETGPDDEALWERLGAKVVDIDKAKAKAAAEAKEKSDG